MKNYGVSESLEITNSKKEMDIGIVKDISATRNIRTIKDTKPQSKESVMLALEQKSVLGRLEAEALLRGHNFSASIAWKEYCENRK
ncbi:hypothetical protein IID62_11290 [candidate division KSB1 bacterium]|nr:hypothetical protein [candidate division KSB1 bacterium]